MATKQKKQQKAIKPYFHLVTNKYNKTKERFFMIRHSTITYSIIHTMPNENTTFTTRTMKNMKSKIIDKYGIRNQHVNNATIINRSVFVNNQILIEIIIRYEHRNRNVNIHNRM